MPIPSVLDQFCTLIHNPPRFEPFDETIVKNDIELVLEELSQSHSVKSNELVLFPDVEVLRNDLRRLTSGVIASNASQDLIAFVNQDIISSQTSLVPVQNNPTTALTNQLEVHTDSAVYTVKVDGSNTMGKIGRLTKARRRNTSDPSYEPSELKIPIYIAASRPLSVERTTKLGNSAARWNTVFADQVDGATNDDSYVWLAMIVMEVFSLLKSQFQIFPVKVLDKMESNGTDIVRLVSRSVEDKDELTKHLELPLPEKALQRMLDNDGGGSDWILSSTDVLGKTSSQDTEVIFHSVDDTSSGIEYCYHFSGPRPKGDLYLRPIKDNGFETAVRRRMNNIVAARENTQLLMGLEDPFLVDVDATEDERSILGPPH